MNKDKRNNIQLLGTLNNADESGIIANANQVYDANEDKSTQDVSKEHTERIKTLEDKENSMQTTLENISKTGEASAASNVTYNHSDSKLDATNVQQAVDEISTKTVFDISAYHATGETLATYDNLEDALGTNGKNIPQSLRKGGMSVKFVQSSDNKYVQYRLRHTNWTTDVAYWVNIEEILNNQITDIKNNIATVSDGPGDFSIQDKAGNILCLWSKGHIRTKNFDSQSTVNKLNTIEEGAEVNDVETEDESTIPFSLKDENNNTAFLIKQNGHIKTKNFDSEDIQTEDTVNSRVFDLKDNNGNVSLSITTEGHIRTKSFYSKNAYTNKNLNITPILPTSFSTFGTYTDSVIPDNYIVTNGIMTQNNIRMKDELLLTSLHFYANKSGKIHFGIGNIDQRNWAIVSQEFDVDCVQGINDVDIIGLGIIGIRNGYLFAYNNYFGDGCSIGYVLRSSSSSYNLVYSDTINGALAELDTTTAPFGAYPALSYKQSTSKSIYDLKGVADNGRQDTDQIVNKVAYVQNAINEIKGADGNYYKIIVDSDGNIGTQRVNYAKITIFGNSIWTHDPISGWLYPLDGNNNSTWNYTGETETAIGMSGRGMGATTQAFDFKHLFRRGMQVNFPNIVVQGANIANIERNLPTNFGYTNLLTPDVDVIFWRAGENVSASPVQYAAALRRYFAYFKQQSPNAKIIATGRFWNAVNSDNAVKEVCDEFCIPYIKMYLKDADLYQARSYDIVTLPMENSVSGVIETKYEVVGRGAGHPSNLGFLEIANRMLLSLNQSPLILTHSVIVENIGNYNYKCRNIGIEGELYTMNVYKASANVIVKDEQNNTISTTILTSEDVSYLSNNMIACVFTMPSSNIVITLN